MFIKKHLWAVAYGLLLTAFTVYLALDAFVIARVYTAAPAVPAPAVSSSDAPDGGEESAAQTALSRRQRQPQAANRTQGSARRRTSQQNNDEIQEGAAAVQPPTVQDAALGSCEQNGVAVTLTAHWINDTDVYVADVRLSSIEQLKTAFAQDAYGRNVTETISDIAARCMQCRLSTATITARSALAKTGFVYLLLSILCALFGAVYEHFSHGAYSPFMLYAFAFLLVGGALPFCGMSLFGRRCAVPAGLYHAGLVTLTVGGLVQGALQIYGTTNPLTAFYWWVGGALTLAGAALTLRRSAA